MERMCVKLLIRPTLTVLGFMALLGCQSTPTPLSQPKSEQPKVEPSKTTSIPDGIKITPYERPEIQRERIVIPAQKAVEQKFDDGRQFPAFKELMQQTHIAFKQGNWDKAEQAAMHAQRLAPQSSETYMYLAMISNHKNQAPNAESLARRGLSYAQSNTMKRQLWQIILKSAQMQKNSKTIQEAQSRLRAL